ncbi:hypothetical protein FB451DRAFT_1166024 [Mycena latifolia]|nr:hypothetical protein FB451DRAFT_1166024 [Mycena latifolia]
MPKRGFDEARAGLEQDCKMAQALPEDGPVGESPPLLREDSDYLFQFTMAQVNRNRDEIVRVWEEQPARTPLVSFDFSQDPNGVMVVGERCVDVAPGNDMKPLFATDPEEGPDAALFRERWKERERAQGVWMSIGIKNLKEFRDGEGTVLEKLIKTVEDGVEYSHILGSMTGLEAACLGLVCMLPTLDSDAINLGSVLSFFSDSMRDTECIIIGVN